MAEVFRPSSKYIFAQGAAIFVFLLIFSFEVLVETPLLFLVIIIIPIISALITYYFTYYEIRDNGVFIRKGLIFRSQSLFLYTQIQDVEEFKGVLDRVFAIGNLRIVTMSGASTIQGVVSGLEREEAIKFKELVVANINKTAKKEVLPTVAGPAVQVSQADFKANPYAIQINRGTIYSTLGIFLISLFVFIMIILFTGFHPVYLLFFLIINLGFVFFSYLMIMPYKYSISKDWLQLRYKFLVEQVSNYRFDRIQNVIIKEPWTYRLGGLASVLIETGEKPVYSSRDNSSTGRFATMIPALNVEDAHKLKNEILEKMGLPKDEKYTNLRSQFPLDRQKPLKKTVSFTFYFVLVAAGLAFALFNFIPGIKVLGLQTVLFAALGVIVVSIILKYIYEVYYFDNYSYKTTQRLLSIKKGVLEHTEVFLPYSRVQNIFVDMDIFDRIFDLRDTHLSTIGYSTVAHAHIDGVDPENAEKLKNALLEMMKKNKK
ncbi:PH domain-containing protein [Candidatus Micrarchaeota archaeon]|nr:PH domain-containing protein [Candidatus Micrarchaeota archaeon]